MLVDMDEARERLREWAYFFRDRSRKNRTMSAEGAWVSPQCWESPKPRPAYDPRRASHTWALLRQMPKDSYRTLTWRYCYPFVPVWVALRSLSHPKRVGRRVTLKDYESMIQVGEYRLAILIYNSREEGYIPPQYSGEVRRVATL